MFASSSGTLNPTTQSNAASLSHDAIVGLAVGCFFALILLLALGLLIYKKCFPRKPPPSHELDELRPRKPQVVSDDHMVIGLEDIRRTDSASQDHFRSESSSVVSPLPAHQGLVPGEQRHRTPSPAHLPPPPSTSSWEPSIPPPRR